MVRKTALVAIVLALTMAGSVVTVAAVAQDDGAAGNHAPDEMAGNETADPGVDANETDDDAMDDEAADGADANETEDEAMDEMGVTQQTAFVSVAHASPDAPAVDVMVDNATVASGLSFGNATQYMALEGGSYDMTISVAGNESAVVYEENVTVDARSVVTFVATGEVTENATGEVTENATQPFSVTPLMDDAWTPAEDEAAVRVAHLSPDAPTVDVTANEGSVVLADNASFGDVTDYLTVPAGNHTVEVRAATADNNGSIVASFDVSLENESAYTAWAGGYLAPEDAPADTPFGLFVTQDATATIELPGEAMGLPEDVPPETPGEGPPEDAGEGAGNETDGEGAPGDA